MLPAETLDRLRVPIIGQETFELVSGQFLVAKLALMEIEWLGARRSVRVLASDTYDSLIGTELLDGNRLLIDYFVDIVTLTDQAI